MPQPRGGKDLVVHHINGNHFDDRPENRQIKTRSQHSRDHRLGTTTSYETKRKMRLLRIGFCHTEETKEKIRRFATNRRLSDETREKISRAKRKN